MHDPIIIDILQITSRLWRAKVVIHAACLHEQVGKIKDIREGKKGSQISVQVAWFYRPEEAVGGRKARQFALLATWYRHDLISHHPQTPHPVAQAFHGEKELFKSDHLDWCYASTIESKCKVHSLHYYQVCFILTHSCDVLGKSLLFYRLSCSWVLCSPWKRCQTQTSLRASPTR